MKRFKVILENKNKEIYEFESIASTRAQAEIEALEAMKEKDWGQYNYKVIGCLEVNY